jgi:hypothetical protein
LANPRIRNFLIFHLSTYSHKNLRTTPNRQQSKDVYNTRVEVLTALLIKACFLGRDTVPSGVKHLKARISSVQQLQPLRHAIQTWHRISPRIAHLSVLFLLSCYCNNSLVATPVLCLTVAKFMTLRFSVLGFTLSKHFYCHNFVGFLLATCIILL